MIRTIVSGWAAAIVATLIAADLPAQEARPDAGRRFRGGHQCGEGWWTEPAAAQPVPRLQ